MNARVGIFGNRRAVALKRISKGGVLRVVLGLLAAVAAGNWDWDSSDRSPAPAVPALQDRNAAERVGCRQPSRNAEPCLAPTWQPHRSIEAVIDEIARHSR